MTPEDAKASAIPTLADLQKLARAWLGSLGSGPTTCAEAATALRELTAAAERLAALPDISDVPQMPERAQALIDAVMEWSAERAPDDTGDARLMKAIMTYDGDHTEPCEGCDGDCGEACAPITVAAAHRMYDKFIEDWNRKRGIVAGRSTR